MRMELLLIFFWKKARLFEMGSLMMFIAQITDCLPDYQDADHEEDRCNSESLVRKWHHTDSFTC